MTLVASVNRKGDNPAWDVQQNGENSRCGRQMGPRSSVSAAVVISLSLVTAFHSHSADAAPSTNPALTGWRFSKAPPQTRCKFAIVTIATCAPLIWAVEIRSYGGSVKCDLSFSCLALQTLSSVFVLILTVLLQAEKCASHTRMLFRSYLLTLSHMTSSTIWHLSRKQLKNTKNKTNVKMNQVSNTGAESLQVGNVCFTCECVHEHILFCSAVAVVWGPSVPHFSSSC